MSDGESLLKAILLDPADDTARLVYADWLDENGQSARAETIRGQIHLKRTGEWSPKACVRAGEEDEWFPFPHDAVRRVWSRGFVESVTLTADDFTANAKKLFAAHPITTVTLTDRSPRADGARVWVYHVSLVGRMAWASYFGRQHYQLPDALHRHLPNCRRSMSSPKYKVHTFRSEAIARAALFAACVTYGRWLNGMPALNAQPVEAES